jgi:hypothetical protein
MVSSASSLLEQLDAPDEYPGRTVHSRPDDVFSPDLLSRDPFVGALTNDAVPKQKQKIDNILERRTYFMFDPRSEKVHTYLSWKKS